MSKIIISEAAQKGIQGATRQKPIHTKEYDMEMEKATTKIQYAYEQYRKVYQQSKNLIART